MFTKKKSGLTLIELLVVMIIIAILASIALPAIVKARQQAAIHKVMAEMTSFASTLGTVKIDTRGYVTLNDLSLPTANSGINPGTPSVPLCFQEPDSTTSDTQWKADLSFWDPGTLPARPGPGITDLSSRWDGPYAVFQPNTTFGGFNIPPGADWPIKTNDGSLMSGVPSSTPTRWGKDAFPSGTPLDSWGHPFCLAWNSYEQVMVVYSAGPNGNIETAPGVTTPVGDDLLYKFR